jgi:3-oxoacyl-[acyl-carrier protein] reductase
VEVTEDSDEQSGSDGAFVGRVALVTGGSGGIGAALSVSLARAGAAVAVHYRGGRRSAERVVGEIEAFGGRAVALAANLGDRDAPERLIVEVETALGGVDILAANAGVAPVAAYDDVDGADFDEVLAINLRAPYLLARRVLPRMREQRWGRILFTSSVAALTGGVIGPHYAASKAGLHGLAHHLAGRVAPDGYVTNQTIGIDGGIHPT